MGERSVPSVGVGRGWKKLLLAAVSRRDWSPDGMRVRGARRIQEIFLAGRNPQL
jgi:hypothetical protein